MGSKPSTRIYQLDFFRGIFLLVMAFNHLLASGFRDIHEVIFSYSYQPFGFVSAADGLITVSGIVMGYMYASKSVEDLQTSLCKRFLEIYKHHLFTVFALFALFMTPSYVSSLPQMGSTIQMWIDQPLTVLLSATLIFQGTYIDLLPIYLALIPLSYLALHNFHSGRYKVILAMSGVAWLIGQLEIQLRLRSISGFNFGHFELLSWQFLFILSLSLGFFLGRKGMSQIQIKLSWIIGAITIALVFFIVRQSYGFRYDAIPLSFMFERRTLGLFRIVNITVFAYIFYCLSSSLKFNNGFVCKIGMYALPVFTYHVLLCYSFLPFQSEIAQFAYGAQLILITLATASIYFPAKIMHTIKRRKLRL